MNRRRVMNTEITNNQILNISVEKLQPHKDNPRKTLGNLTELVESIKNSGIMQNLTVVPNTDTDGEYTVIIGHRRLAAAKEAGLQTVPCVIVDLSPQEQLATMLLENMQRSDLTAREQAEGIQMMLNFGESIESVSQKTGLSESTVRRRVSLMKLDSKKMDSAESRGVTLEQYIKASELKTAEARNKVLDAAGTDNFNSVYKRELKEQIIKENTPKVKKELKTIATEIKDFSPWGSRYVNVKRVDIHEWKPGDFNIKPNTDTKYMFGIYFGTAYLVKEAPKQTNVQKKSEKEKSVMRRNRELKKITKHFYELRLEFIENFTAGKKYEEILKEWLVAISQYNLAHYTPEFNKKFLRQQINQKIDDYYVDKKLLYSFFENEPNRSLVILDYVYCGDKEENGYYHMGRSEYMPTHDKNLRLDLIYKYLCKLGYQMADEEKQLQDGTHQLFNKE